MNIEEYIVMRVNLLLHTDSCSIVKRLEGGMSNYTYVVDAQGKRHTYRVPGKYAERFVDRDTEWDNIRKVDVLGLNNKTEYMELGTGEKLAEYVEGIIMSETDIVSYNSQSVAALKRLHQSGLRLNDYNAFGRLDSYERYCREMSFQHPKEYLELRASLEHMHDQHRQVELVPCHCDYQPTNLVIDGDRFYVLDWEFAGMNDPLYDIACYGNAGFDKALALLDSYLGHKASNEELRRLYYHRAFQCLQWYNVAIFKDRVGLSRDLNMNFDDVALMFFGMARDLIKDYATL